MIVPDEVETITNAYTRHFSGETSKPYEIELRDVWEIINIDSTINE